MEQGSWERERASPHPPPPLGTSASLLQEKASNPKAKPPVPNPLLLGLSPSAYVLRVVGRVRSSELEQALLLLPFTDALHLLGYIVGWLRVGTQVGEQGSSQGRAGRCWGGGAAGLGVVCADPWAPGSPPRKRQGRC